MKIKEVIVVEGKHDTQRIKEAVDADTIETGGSSLGEEVLERIEHAGRERGVIVFTDPDSPGDRIRTIVNQRIPGCKNAYLLKSQAKTEKKVGIEHASLEVIREALYHVAEAYDGQDLTLTFEEFVDCGLMGRDDSKERRELLAKEFHIGQANGKTCYKRLNSMRVTKEQILKVLEEHK